MKLAAVAAAALLYIPNGTATTHHRTHAATPRAYAYQLAHARGWVGYEWQALDIIVGRESGWQPCRHYPSTTDCRYAGANACGIPQRYPCPYSWRGRLDTSWRDQVRELIRYVRDRYGSPSRALDWWNTHQSY